MALTLTQYSGHLAEYATANRGGVKKNPDQSDMQPGIQKLQIITSNAGQTYTLYYDPAADRIFYDTGTPVLSQS